MSSLPRPPDITQDEIGLLLRKVEQQLLRLEKEKDAAKKERRLLRRTRRNHRIRKLKRIGRRLLVIVLMVAGAAAFLTSTVLFATGVPGCLDYFETAAAAWGLAALVRPATKK